MKKLILLLTIFYFSNDAKSQILTKRTSPQTIQNEIPGYSSISAINFINYNYTPLNPNTSFNPINGDTLSEKDGLSIYANKIPVTITNTNGNVTSTPVGKVWTLKINIPNALNIGLTFSQCNLSQTAEMYVYNEAKTTLKHKIMKEHFVSSSPKVISSLKGNSITIYIVEPGNFGAFQSTISINYLLAGFLDIADVGDVQSNQSESTNCIPYIQCYPDKVNVARAVARVAIDKGNNFYGFCTGTLVNNELNNGRPYFLTAFHCIDANDNGALEQAEIDALNTSLFRFRFWRTQCNGSTNEAFLEFTGAILRASYQNSDMVLLELIDQPGIGDGVNYAGWYRGTNSPSGSNSFIIHHPQREDMRYTGTSSISNYWGNLNFWQAYYSVGVVEQGSSGASLFNEYNQIVGQLKGGWTSCNYTNFSDRYGKISQSWLGTGQPNGNLQNWLSPTLNEVSTGLLNLTEIPINGPSLLGCTTPGTFTTLPGLLDVTYEWSVSNNMQVVNGQNTPSANISFINGTYGFGTITMTLRSPTKGRTRELIITKTVTRSAGGIQGTYNSPSGSGTPLSPSVPKQMIVNNACVGEYIHCSMSIPFGSTVTWNGTGNNWYQSGSDLYFYLSELNQQASFSITVTNSCGTETKSYNFKGVSGSCGGTPLRVALSPNPTTSSTVTASLINTSNNNKVNIKEIKILDKTGNLKKYLKLNGTNVNVLLDISSLSSDIYTVLVFDGKIWIPGRFIKN